MKYGKITLRYGMVRYVNFLLASTVHSIQWNTGMGNTDTLHLVLLFLFFFHPYIAIKTFLTSLYAHAHETTPTSS